MMTMTMEWMMFEMRFAGVAAGGGGVPAGTGAERDELVNHHTHHPLSLASCCTPVSYTHLDVYKRQLLNN